MSEFCIGLIGFAAAIVAVGGFATIAMILWVKGNFYDSE